MDAPAALMTSVDDMRWEADAAPLRGMPVEKRQTPCGADPLRMQNGRESSVTDARGRELPIYKSVGPGGRPFPLLKAMLTTACERDCHYCAFAPAVTSAGRLSGRRRWRAPSPTCTAPG